MKNWDVKKIVLTAMMAGLAGVLMSFEFSIPLMPTFYKIDFSDVPAIIALFSMGPLSGAMVEIIKIVIKLLTVGTNSMYVGEFISALDAVLLVVPIWFFYTKLGKTRKAVIISLIAGIIIRIAWACFANIYISLPMYASAFGMPIDAIVKMVGNVNPRITNLNSFILFATIPFNLIKFTANYFISYILLERLAAVRPSFHFIHATE